MEPRELRERVKAVTAVLPTPMNRDGSVDFDGLRANVRFLVEHCKNRRFCLVPTGSTGEFYTMGPGEHLEVIEAVVDEAAGRLPVIAGTGAAGTHQAILLSQSAQRAGADGVQVVLPYYHVPSEEGLYRHFADLGDALQIGVMIYNNPAVSKLWMPPRLMARCAGHPSLIADKENTTDVMMFKAMRDTVDPSQMTVVCGLGDLQFAYEAALGCPGFVSWTSNFAPELSLNLLEAADACDFDRVRLLGGRVGRLYEFAQTCAVSRGRDPWVLPGSSAGHVYVAVLKAAMELRGLAGGPVRGPGDDLGDGERRALRNLMQSIGLLPEEGVTAPAQADTMAAAR